MKGAKGTRWETPKEWQARLGKERWAELRKWENDHRWHPHQLRHNAATRIRKRYGLEAARVVLGQKAAKVAEIYAEVDQTRPMTNTAIIIVPADPMTNPRLSRNGLLTRARRIAPITHHAQPTRRFPLHGLPVLESNLASTRSPLRRLS